MKRYFTSALLIAAAIVLIGICSGGASAQVQQQGKLRLLTAFGDANVSIVPDQAEVRIGVETEAPTATQSRQENADRAQKLTAVLKSIGIPDNDIRTITYQINPVRRYDEKVQGLPPIVGYQVQNIISVRTSKMDLVPSILDKSVGDGANRVDGINFIVKDDTTAKQEVLRKAVAAARSNAQQMAAELGVKLDKVYSIQQGGVGSNPSPVFISGKMSAEASTPVFPGETTLNASATIVYIIK